MPSKVRELFFVLREMLKIVVLHDSSSHKVKSPSMGPRVGRGSDVSSGRELSGKKESAYQDPTDWRFPARRRHCYEDLSRAKSAVYEGGTCVAKYRRALIAKAGQLGRNGAPIEDVSTRRLRPKCSHPSLRICHPADAGKAARAVRCRA